jgi:hypothetical protein
LNRSSVRFTINHHRQVNVVCVWLFSGNVYRRSIEIHQEAPTVSFLSLAKGDPAARDLLQRAVRARYGLRPLPLESVRFEMTGQRRGLLGLPVRVNVTTCFITDSHWRWDETWRLLGLLRNAFSVSFDSGSVYFRQGTNVEPTNDSAALQGARRRLWGEACALLTPLTMPGVVLKSVDAQTFEASPENQPEDVAQLRLSTDDTLDSVRTEGFHPELRQVLPLVIRPTGGLQTLEGFTLPRQVTYEWGGDIRQTFTIGKAEANPKIPLTEFTMG